MIPCLSDSSEIKYRSQIIELLKMMDMGEVRPMDKNSHNYDRFIANLKIIINSRITNGWGFEIDFNPDYSKFRKLPTLQTTRS